jgi:hypothetical protein
MPNQIHPVLAFRRDPTGSVLFDVSAMIPKIRLGMPTVKQLLSMKTPDRMVSTMAEPLVSVCGPVA